MTHSGSGPSPSHPVLALLAEAIVSQVEDAYLVGGYLRDLLLGLPPSNDIDIAVKGDVQPLAEWLAVSLNGHIVPLDPERGIIRVILPGEDVSHNVDLSTITGDIRDDLARRDFTINAMAVRLQSTGGLQLQVIDPFGGQTDLRSRVIRSVAEDVFAADGLRLLRAVRLCAALGFRLDDSTAANIRRQAHHLEGTAFERQRDELMRILAVSNAGKYVRVLDELGLLTRIIPELSEGKGVSQPQEHHYDVFQHGLEAVSALDVILSSQRPEQPERAWLWQDLHTQLDWYSPSWPRWQEVLADGCSRAALLKLAGLLHDIAKPASRSVDAQGRIRFLGHAARGADMTSNVLRRLAFSSWSVGHVSTLVREHLRPVQIAHDGLPSRRAIFRLFRDCQQAAADVLFLSLADHLAARGPSVTQKGWRAHVALINYILVTYEELSSGREPRLLDGHDLMKEMGLPPGPLIGRLLEIIVEAQALGAIHNRKEALKLARRELVRPGDLKG